MELRDVVGSIRKGQVTILEEVNKISQQMSSHFPSAQAGASNQLPEQPSQNLEQSGEPASQQSLIDLDLEERETRELLDSLSSHNTIDDLSMSRASSVFSVNADPDFDWAQPLPSQQSNFAQTTPTTSAQKPFYPAPSTSVALPLYQANPAYLALPRPAPPASTPAMPFYHTNPAPSIPNPAMPNPASTPAMPFYQANPASSISYPRYVQPSPPNVHSCYANPALSTPVPPMPSYQANPVPSTIPHQYEANPAPQSATALPMSYPANVNPSAPSTSYPVSMPPPKTPPRTGRPQNRPFTPKKRLDEILSKYTLEKDAGRATNQLAELYFFGPHTMATNTVSTLDQERLKQVKSIILSRFGRKKSVADQELLWSRCRTALGQRCKNMRCELRRRQF